MEQDSIGQVVKHECPNRKQQQQQQQKNVSENPSADLSAVKEVAEIKARLLVILDRLSSLEKELQK